MTVRVVIDVLGWFGAVLILMGYVMVSMRGVRGDNRAYQAANFVGSVCLIVNTLYYRAFPATALNVVWSAIALYTLIVLTRRTIDEAGRV